MLRVIQHRNAAAAKSYYTAQADYYLSGQELQGRWFGRGATLLGLSGDVEQQDFYDLCNNVDPHSQKTLTGCQRANRTCAYDFNFHAPKSFSILTALTPDDELRNTLRHAMESAAQDALTEVEAEMRTRVRKGKVNSERVTGNLVAALFTHTTSRPVDLLPDPHEHVHAVILNATHDPVEQEWKAGQFRLLKQHAPYYEAIFHASLAKRMSDLGFTIERSSKSWEIAGIPKSLSQKFSRRTAQIEAEAIKRGVTSDKEKDQLGAKTRENKVHSISPSELRCHWQSQCSPEEWNSLQNAYERSPGSTPSPLTAQEAKIYAIEQGFERASVVAEKRLLAAALWRGVGQVDVHQVKQAFQEEKLIGLEEEGERWVTTQAVLAEEQGLVSFARQGRGSCRPLADREPVVIRRGFLNEDQRAAIEQVLTSKDRVLLIQGKAGTGKTTLMKEAIEQIEERGKEVCVCAPTAEAARGVLRKEGFAAETVAQLLVDQSMQERLKGGVLWIDEAGLLGTKTLARVFAIANEQQCRVILSGDTSQHHAVDRGDAMQLLMTQAGLQPALVNTIQRQTGAYQRAVHSISLGKVADGYQQLEQLGWVHEVTDDTSRYQQLASDYLQAMKQGQSVLAISPTHQEGEAITQAIRSSLLQEGLLGTREETLLRLNPTHWTAAERKNATSYHEGDVVQYVQNAKGHQRGERLTVHQVIGDEVQAQTADGRHLRLALDQAERFQVFRPGLLPLREKDPLLIRQNGTTIDGKHKLNNGSVYRVAGFTKEGNVQLDNGWVISKSYGQWSHGYCLTSHAAQGKTHDVVLVGQGSDSLTASNQQQFYVSVSRGRKRVEVYTDDASKLKEAVQRKDIRQSASALAEQLVKQPKSLLHRFANKLQQWHESMKGKARQWIDNKEQRGFSYGR